MARPENRRMPGAREPVALYHQIFLKLRDEIVSGARPYGASLPTEEELSAEHKVSRITARRALSELSDAGLVERRRRIGTRVIFNAKQEPIETSIEQAVESLLSFGRKTKVRVVEIVRAAAPAPVAAALEIAAGAEVVRATRLRTQGGAPLGCVVSYVPSRLGRLITRKALSAAPMLAVLQDGGVRFGGARQTIAALAADPQMAGLLETEPRAPLLVITRTVLGADGAPVLMTEARYRGDRYQIRLDLQASGAMHIDS